MQTKGWIDIRLSGLQSVSICWADMFSIPQVPHVGGGTAGQVTMGTHSEEQWHRCSIRSTFSTEYFLKSPLKEEKTGF